MFYLNEFIGQVIYYLHFNTYFRQVCNYKHQWRWHNNSLIIKYATYYAENYIFTYQSNNDCIFHKIKHSTNIYYSTSVHSLPKNINEPSSFVEWAVPSEKNSDDWRGVWYCYSGSDGKIDIKISDERVYMDISKDRGIKNISYRNTTPGQIKHITYYDENKAHVLYIKLTNSFIARKHKYSSKQYIELNDYNILYTHAGISIDI